MATLPTTSCRAWLNDVSRRADITSGTAIVDESAAMPIIDLTPNKLTRTA